MSLIWTQLSTLTLKTKLKAESHKRVPTYGGCIKGPTEHLKGGNTVFTPWLLEFKESLIPEGLRKVPYIPIFKFMLVFLFSGANQ